MVVELEEKLRKRVSLVTMVVTLKEESLDDEDISTMDCTTLDDVVKNNDVYCVVPLMVIGDSKEVPLEAVKCESLNRTNGGDDCRNNIAAQITVQ